MVCRTLTQQSKYQAILSACIIVIECIKQICHENVPSLNYAKAKTKFTTNMNWICLSDLILTSFEAAVRSTGYIKKTES